MTSLAEVYEGGSGGDNLRRLYLGVALFLTGVALVFAGIVFATTDLGASLFGLNWEGQRELAGVIAGVGLPAVFLGVLSVLPASRFVRGAALAGAAVAMVGVVLFWAVYPENWVRGEQLALFVVVVYFAGAIATFWCLFTGVANFKTRNDPGGTVTLEITEGGETRVVEVEGENLSQRLGGIGLLGTTPDGDVATQTAGDASARSDGGTGTDASGPAVGPNAGPGPADDAELLDEDDPADRTDAYCGNCAHFSYVRTEEGLEPYCGYYGELMDDMDPCRHWERT
ncbi:hypothetical protein BRC94_03825 [Halobacteriales archaeon QS_5_70_17]|jgi:hypothetical protein|nr:MAG: hypothetical protein BRC94_03825 [Halobacteriales archaeon QS_5_70_17]